MIEVTVIKPRPDFRVFIDLLFGFGHNVDSDGDSDFPYSKDWRYLYIKDRENIDLSIEIFSEDVKPLVFKVKSKSNYLEELAALYLYLYCGESAITNNDLVAQTKIKAFKDKYFKELNRASNSIWHKSSKENPYPNL